MSCIGSNKPVSVRSVASFRKRIGLGFLNHKILRKIGSNYDSLANCLSDRQVRYVPSAQTAFNWLKFASRDYDVLPMSEISKQGKQSDTIFILGGSESINLIDAEAWRSVAKHDSVGMNWWPVHDFVPTYYYSNYPQDEIHFDYYRKIIGSRIERYKRSIFLVICI
jgi:hypothetical protein